MDREKRDGLVCEGLALTMIFNRAKILIMENNVEELRKLHKITKEEANVVTILDWIGTFQSDHHLELVQAAIENELERRKSNREDFIPKLNR